MARRAVRKQKPQPAAPKKTSSLLPTLGGVALTGAIVAAILNMDKLKHVNLVTIDSVLDNLRNIDKTLEDLVEPISGRVNLTDQSNAGDDIFPMTSKFANPRRRR